MKPNILRKICGIAVVATSLALLSACSATPAVSKTTSAQSDVTLTWWTYSSERLDFFKQAAAEFHKTHPNITIKPQAMTQDDYMQALPLSFRSHNAPDIFVYDYSPAGSYFELNDVIANKWAQPLDNAVLPKDFRSRFLDTSNLMDPIYSRGKSIYTVPEPPATGVVGAGYLYFNKDVIAQAGLTDNLPKTWAQFTAACKAIEAKTKAKCLAQPMQAPVEVDRLITPFISVSAKGYRPGGPGVTTGDFSEITQPDFVSGMEYLRSLYAGGYVIPGAYTKEVARQSIANGQAAFYFDGGWMSSVFPQTYKFTNFGVTLPPAKSSPAPGGYTGRIGQGPPNPETFISAQSKHPREATEFLEWMTRPDGWYTQHFTEQGFDILPWADPKKVESWLPKDNPTRDLIPLSPQVHVLAPQPAIKCPDLSKSQALTDVANIQPNWVQSTMVQYLLNGGDWLKIATPIAAKQNAVFKSELKQEAASGLKVSVNCFKAPGWNGTSPYKPGK